MKKTFLKPATYLAMFCLMFSSCLEEEEKPPFTIVDGEGLDVNLYWTVEGKTSDYARFNSDLDVLVVLEGETKFSSESDFLFEIAKISPDSENGTYLASIRLNKKMEKTNYVMTIKGSTFTATKAYEFKGSFSEEDSAGKIQDFLKIVKTDSAYTFSLQ